MKYKPAIIFNKFFIMYVNPLSVHLTYTLSFPYFLDNSYASFTLCARLIMKLMTAPLLYIPVPHPSTLLIYFQSEEYSKEIICFFYGHIQNIRYVYRHI